MSRIADVFANLAERQETALVAYLTAGYPSLDETMGLLAAAVEGGADIVELGVPFSDPMGDGPVIQQTTDAALRAGTTTAQVVELVAAARDEGIEVPIALMGYLNPFLHYGPKRLCVDAVAAGVDGLIVPDLPAHQADEWLPPARASGLDAIFFGAPGSRTDRLERPPPSPLTPRSPTTSRCSWPACPVRRVGRWACTAPAGWSSPAASGASWCSPNRPTAESSTPAAQR